MKKIFFFFCVLMIMLTGCSHKSVMIQDNKTDINNNVIYNNAYNYEDEEIQFLIKERGYVYEEKYNDKPQTFSKKELLSLVSINNDSILSEVFFYEIYLTEKSENFLVRGQLYKGDSKNQYFSNLIIRDLIDFGDEMVVKIIKDDSVIKEFSIRKVVE